MNQSIDGKKQGYYLVFGAIAVGLLYEFIPRVITSQAILTPLGTVFNVLLMGAIAYFILKGEFLEWFKHFSFKWLLIGIPLQLVVGIGFSLIWAKIGTSHDSNTVDSVLSWSFVAMSIPLTILGEEVLSISILYGLWEKLKLPFWLATLICSVLFATWHLSSYGYNLLQCLVTLVPSRIVLNYLFKKSESIWVSFIAHLLFDLVAFLPILLGQ